MRDLHPAVWTGIPVGSFLLMAAAAIYDADFYLRYVRLKEFGYLEQTTVLFLVAAIVFSVLIFAQRRRMPRLWLGWCALLLGAGALYFAGEEASWGQHIFSWTTPEVWTDINYQNETNIHNISGLFNELPRGLLTLTALVSVFLPWIQRRRRAETWDPHTSIWPWLMPTRAVVPSALVSVVITVPAKLADKGPVGRFATVPDWFELLAMNHMIGELKEHFLAIFILMFLWSWHERLRTQDSSSGRR